MRRRRSIHGMVVSLITFAGGAFVSPASAGEVGAATERTATCNVTDVRITLTLGVGTNPGKGTFSTQSPTGNLECTGSIHGRGITGPGTFAEEGTWEGDCSGGTAASTITVALQTIDGPVTADFPVRIMFRPGWGWKWSDTLVGSLVFEYYPTQGDCLNAPVTEIMCSGQALAKS